SALQQQRATTPGQAMALKAVLVAAAAASTAVPSTVHGFCLAPTLLLPCANSSPHPLPCTRYSVAVDHNSAPLTEASAPTVIFSERPALLGKRRGVASPSNRASSVRLMLGSAAGEPVTSLGRPGRRAGLGLGMKADSDRPRVSRALNRALGNILSAGDMFGGVSGKGVAD
ncbi:unnamed protein product, partial [Laminaria digitata]